MASQTFANQSGTQESRKIEEMNYSCILAFLRDRLEGATRTAALRSCHSSLAISPAPIPISNPFSSTDGLMVKNNTMPFTGELTFSKVSPNKSATVPIYSLSFTASPGATSGYHIPACFVYNHSNLVRTVEAAVSAVDRFAVATALRAVLFV